MLLFLTANFFIEEKVVNLQVTFLYFLSDMKKFNILLISIFTALSAMADGQIRWLETKADFGAFDEDTGAVSTVFRFVNDTNEPVAIIAANASCGCTAPIYSREPVAVGDTAKIEVRYDPAGRPGRFEKFVSVRTSADDTKTKLIVRGVVVGSESSVGARYPVAVGPISLKRGAVMLGKIKSGHAKMEFLDGYNRAHDSISPTVEGLPKYLEVTTVPRRVAPGEQVQFNFYFRADRCPQWGIVTDSVTIIPDPAVADRIVLPVVAIIEEDFSRLTPGQMKNAPEAALDTDRVILDAEGKGSIHLTNRGKDPLKIRRIYTQDAGLEVSTKSDSVKKGKSAEITVTATPEALAKGINARATIITNDPSNPTITFRIVAEQK